MPPISYTVFKEIIHGNVTLSGSAEQLSNVVSKVVTIQAKTTNTGSVYIGYDNTVDTDSWGAELTAGSSITLNIKNLNLIYINGTASDIIGYIVER